MCKNYTYIAIIVECLLNDYLITLEGDQLNGYANKKEKMYEYVKIANQRTPETVGQ